MTPNVTPNVTPKKITLFVVVDSAMSPLRKRIDVLVRGSAAKIISFGIRVPPTLELIAKTKPSVCIIEATGSQTALLAFARRVTAESPATRIVMMGEKIDSVSLARAAVSGVCNFLPVVINHREFNTAIVDAAAGRQPGDESPFGQAMALLPPRPRRSRAARMYLGMSDRDEIDRCRSLGLTEDEITHFLCFNVDLVRRYCAAKNGKMGGNSTLSAREAAMATASVVLVAIAWVVSHIWQDSQRSPPFAHHPVSGRILYEDGEVIPAEAITLTFLSTEPLGDRRTCPRPGLAVVEPVSGRFGWVTSHRHGDGIVKGAHRVLVTGKDFMPLPATVVPQDYAEHGATPLEVVSPLSSLDLRVRRPPPAPGEPSED